MKKIIYFLMSVVLLTACGTAQTAAEKEAKAFEIRNAIDAFDFKFSATYAYPTGYRSIYLSPYYDVEVSPDTVNAYLPYYGRAYTAPMDPREGGIKFESTDFEYQTQPGKRAGNYLVTIRINDANRPIMLYFDIWENGSARLDVTDQNRQPISFQGDVELRNEE